MNIFLFTFFFSFSHTFYLPTTTAPALHVHLLYTLFLLPYLPYLPAITSFLLFRYSTNSVLFYSIRYATFVLLLSVLFIVLLPLFLPATFVTFFFYSIPFYLLYVVIILFYYYFFSTFCCWSTIFYFSFLPATCYLLFFSILPTF